MVFLLLAVILWSYIGCVLFRKENAVKNRWDSAMLHGHSPLSCRPRLVPILAFYYAYKRISVRYKRYGKTIEHFQGCTDKWSERLGKSIVKCSKSVLDFEIFISLRENTHFQVSSGINQQIFWFQITIYQIERVHVFERKNHLAGVEFGIIFTETWNLFTYWSILYKTLKNNFTPTDNLCMTEWWKEINVLIW